MTNLTNYHSHSTYCDGRASVEAFIQEALRQGFYSYGTSSHSPLPFATAWNMNPDRLSVYLQEISLLKESYADRIEFYRGMEIDYLTDDYHPAIPYFQEMDLDYRIGSVHFLEDVCGELIDIDQSATRLAEITRDHFEGDLVELVRAYFLKTQRMIRAGGFDFVGHIDKISMSAGGMEAGLTKQRWYIRLVEDTLEAVAQAQLFIEVNTKAYTNKMLFFPNKEHFGLVRELGIPVVVNSDSHTPDKINDGRRAALQALVRAEFDCVHELSKGSWSAKQIVYRG